MKLHRELNEGTIYAESAWLNLIDEMTKSVETSNFKKEILETNLVPLGLGSEDITGDIFALIRGPEQGLGRIFNDNIDKNTTSLIIKLVQNCHFMKIKMRNQATKQNENLEDIAELQSRNDENLQETNKKLQYNLDGKHDKIF